MIDYEIQVIRVQSGVNRQRRDTLAVASASGSDREAPEALFAKAREAELLVMLLDGTGELDLV